MHVLPPSALPGYLLPLLSEAINGSGCSIEIVKADEVEFDSQLKLARPGEHYHTLTVSRPYDDHLDHFIASAALKIIRFYQQPQEERYLPASDGGLPELEFRALRSSEPWSLLPGPQFDAVSTFLYRGTVRQLTSYPIDLRVEREIAEHLPEHREKQRAYLHRQVLDFEPTFDPEMVRAFPERIGRASQGMNVAFAEESAELTGVRTGELCRRARYRDVGEDLRERLHAVEEPGAPGDRSLTDQWAEGLDLRSWYRWLRIDDV